MGILGEPIPALLNKTSNLPNFSSTNENKFFTESASPTSVETAIALSLETPDSSIVSFNNSFLLPANATE